MVYPIPPSRVNGSPFPQRNRRHGVESCRLSARISFSAKTRDESRHQSAFCFPPHRFAQYLSRVCTTSPLLSVVTRILRNSETRTGSSETYPRLYWLRSSS